MIPRRGRAVAGYLEVFLLIGVAAAGSATVLMAGLRLVASTQGAAVSVAGGSIRQGAYLAIESLLVQNTGSVPFAWFDVSTSGVANGAAYCYALFDPVSLSTLASTCPAVTTDPEAVPVNATVPPGRAVLVEITVVGQAFSIGASTTVTVTTSAGAQESFVAVAVPA